MGEHTTTAIESHCNLSRFEIHLEAASGRLEALTSHDSSADTVVISPSFGDLREGSFGQERGAITAISDADRRISTSDAKLDIMLIRRIRRRLQTRVMTTIRTAKTTVIGIITSEAEAIPETAGVSLHPDKMLEQTRTVHIHTHTHTQFRVWDLRFRI